MQLLIQADYKNQNQKSLKVPGRAQKATQIWKKVTCHETISFLIIWCLQPFYGEGSTKKASEHAASNNALAFINLQGLLPENLKASLAVDQVDKQQMENTKIAIEALRRDPANTDQASEQNPGATQKQEVSLGMTESRHCQPNHENSWDHFPQSWE